MGSSVGDRRGRVSAVRKQREVPVVCQYEKEMKMVEGEVESKKVKEKANLSGNLSKAFMEAQPGRKKDSTAVGRKRGSKFSFHLQVIKSKESIGRKISN
ncbi:hypothetical protein RUM44_003519 [Polyplax serrata]|uniref:Uncharacterized protein n=1 Tax=Polyplax serrata TaxID=468196 RepID=A0ABR1AGP4_POLSC